MSRPDHTGPPELEFLSALRTQLSVSPSETITRIHVGKMARAALLMRTRRRSRVWRTAIAALCFSTLLSTSGVAVAGRLPGPVQVMVADVARLLPVPLPIPYPTDPLSVVPAEHVSPNSSATVVVPENEEEAPGSEGSAASTEATSTSERQGAGVIGGWSSSEDGLESSRRHDHLADPQRGRATETGRDFLEEEGRSERHDR